MEGMKKHLLKSCLFAIFCVFCAFNVNAASSLFSNYGQIQNVSNYSSNPFWTPNSPYNTAIPRPVYATGPDLKTEDCMNVVQSLVAVQCMVRDNCKNTSLSEIRPEIMIQLSKLPNHNYVTACAGFVDSVYEKYVEYYGTGAPTQVTAFPSATTPNPNTNGGSQIENPYKSHPAQWQLEMQERTQELEELQRQNASESNQLSATNFPATYADLSFSERIANEAAGLELYKDMNAYREINIKNAQEWCNEHPDTPGCSSVQQNNYTSNNGNSHSGTGGGNTSNNGQGDGTTANVPEGHLIAARILKRHMFNGWTDGKTGTSGRGCFAICDKDPLTDNLNGKALYPVLKKSFCADSTRNGLLVESSTKKPLQMTQTEFNDVKQKITTLVMDQDDCDGHFRNHILYIGYLHPETSEFIKTSEIYLDD